jgi:hypothetical protein
VIPAEANAMPCLCNLPIVCISLEIVTLDQPLTNILQTPLCENAHYDCQHRSLPRSSLAVVCVASLIASPIFLRGAGGHQRGCTAAIHSSAGLPAMGDQLTTGVN